MKKRAEAAISGTRMVRDGIINATSDLLLVAQEVGQLLPRQVILPVAVRHHQQEEVASQGHHLVEDGELLVGQRALLVVRVGFL